MKIARTIIAAFLATTMLTVALATTGCGGTSNTDSAKVGEKPVQTAAATVNGEEISEQYVAVKIELILSSDEGYAKGLKNDGATPASLRDDIIETKVTEIIIRQQANKMSITVDPKIIDAQLAGFMARYGSSAASRDPYFQKAGYPTEQDLRDYLLAMELMKQLMEYKGFSVDQFQDWINELTDAADIRINPMPDDAPYNVDMSLADKS